MKREKTIAGRLAWWASLPLLVLTAAAAVLIVIWNLRFQTGGQNPIYERGGHLEAPADTAARDCELYNFFSFRNQSCTLHLHTLSFGRKPGRRSVRVDIAVNDAGEVLYKSHIGYAVNEDDNRWADRFLVLDDFPLEQLMRLPDRGRRFYASGRDEGFYFYADSLVIYDDEGKIIFSQQSDEPGPDKMECQNTMLQTVRLDSPDNTMLTSLWSGSWQDPEECWRMYAVLTNAASGGPVTCREEAYSRPDRKSVFGALAWNEITYETIYPDYYPDSGLHIYSRVLESPIPAALASGWQPILIMAAITALAALYLYMVAERLVTQPLERAIQKTEGLTGPEVHFWQTELDRPDEFGTLGRALKTVWEDFQEKWDTERALERKRQDFVAAASHDLKTPLALIGGYAEAIQQSIDPAENSRYLDSIEREAAKMNRLILEMLDYTRLDRMEQLERSCMEDLPVLLNDWLDEAEPLFQERQLERFLPEHLPVRCDAALLRRVVDNLLSNAVK